MAWYRLHENNPTNNALKQVFDKMDEVGISIVIGTYGRLTVKHNGREVDLVDIEDAADSDRSISNLPPLMEYKLVYERDELKKSKNK